MLLEPNENYTKYIETSKHYLNDPKHMFNSDLHDLGRLQGIEAVIGYLKKFKYAKPVETANQVMEMIKAFPYPKFNTVNVNTYINKTINELPKRCQDTDQRLNAEYQNSKPVYGWWDWAVGKSYNPQTYR